MSQPTWLGSWFVNRFLQMMPRPCRKPFASKKLGLNHLPGRDGPSLLTGVEVCLLSGLSAGTAFVGSADGIEANLTGLESSVGKANRPLAGDFTESETVPTIDSSQVMPESETNLEVLPAYLSMENVASADHNRFTSFNTYLSEPARSEEAVSHSGDLASRNFVGNVDGTMAPQGITDSASPDASPPSTLRNEPAKQSNDTGPVTTNTSPLTFGGDAKMSIVGDRGQLSGQSAAVIESAPDLSALEPSTKAIEKGSSESTVPGVVTETPPTFVDSYDVIDGSRWSESESTPEDALPTVTTKEPSLGAKSEETPTSVTESGSETTFTPTNAEVTPRTDTVGRPLAASTELFRISPSTDAGTSLEVRYTLAAHDANGTVSVENTVTISNASGPVTISAGSALAGRSPDIITIQLKDMAGVRLVKSTGTLFLTPAGERVGDSALFEAHRMGKSPEAFEQLVQRHSPAVLRACQRIIGNRADAEDVTQFVFLTLAQWQLRFPGTLTGWLHTVARNASYALLRSKSRRQRHEREAAKPEMTETADAPSMADDVLDSALSQLPAPLEEAVRLRYLEGWSQQEAAQIVGCPRGTLSRRAAHGIETLRELLGAQPAAVG